MRRLWVGLAALLVCLGAAAGLPVWHVETSGATWTDTSSTGVYVEAAPDWTPPSVVVDDTGGGVLGTVMVGATASDADSGIAQVVIEYVPRGGVSWTALCTATSEPYRCRWDTTTVRDGAYELRATAVDNEGNVEISPLHVTEVVNAASIELDPVPSPMSGPLSLSGRFLDTGTAPTLLLMQYAVAGSGNWANLPGCGPANGPSLSCTVPTGGASGVFDIRVIGQVANTLFTDEATGVVIDNTPPDVTVSVPPAPLRGTIAITATASDPSPSTGVASVQFDHRRGSGSWVTCGTDTTAPYSCSLDTTGVVDGGYEFRATATDGMGNTRSHSVSANIVNQAVTLQPLPALVRGTVPLTASWSGPSGPTVAFQRSANGTSGWTTITGCGSVPAGPASSCSWDTTLHASQTWHVRARIVYNGLTYASQTSTLVDNDKPTVNLVVPPGPLNGSVTLKATASDAHSGVAEVGFEMRRAGATDWSPLCRPDTEAPYDCRLPTSKLPDGTYEFRAVALDVAGNSAASAVETRVIDNTTAPWVRVTDPSSGTVIPQGSSVTVSAEAWAAEGVESVELQYDPPGAQSWTTICVTTRAPYDCTWKTSGVPAGNVDLRAVMTTVGRPGTIVNSAVETVTVERLRGLDVQASWGSNQGLPGDGDLVHLTYSREIDLTTVVPGWKDGSAPQPVPVQLNASNLAGGPGGDWMSFPGTNLGTVGFVQNYVDDGRVITFGGSTMTARTVAAKGGSFTVVTIALSPRTDGGSAGWLNDTNATAGVATWLPSDLVADIFGSTCDPATVAETGTNDADL